MSETPYATAESEAAPPHTLPESHDHPPYLAHHFETPEQQLSTAKLAMWIFLGTEVLMFGGLFCAYAVWRANHYGQFAIGHVHLETFWGALNTAVLILSSFTMAWAVRTAQLDRRKATVALLSLTFLGGLVFMGIKYREYSHKFELGLGPGIWYEAPVRKGGIEGYAAASAELHERIGLPKSTPLAAIRVGTLTADVGEITKEGGVEVGDFELKQGVTVQVAKQLVEVRVEGEEQSYTGRVPADAIQDGQVAAEDGVDLGEVHLKKGVAVEVGKRAYRVRYDRGGRRVEGVVPAKALRMIEADTAVGILGGPKKTDAGRMIRIRPEEGAAPMHVPADTVRIEPLLHRIAKSGGGEITNLSGEGASTFSIPQSLASRLQLPSAADEAKVWVDGWKAARARSQKGLSLAKPKEEAVAPPLRSNSPDGFETFLTSPGQADAGLSFSPGASESHGGEHSASSGGHGGTHGADPYHGQSSSMLAQARTFFSLYYGMTGLHALHVVVGMGLIAWIAIRALSGHFTREYNTPVDLVGIYWHLVDLIWIYLFPLLYLID